MGKRLLIVAASFLLAACSPAPVTPAADPAEAVAAVVEGFGSRLKNVSLLAPDAAQQIEAQYAEFVAPRLLAAWVADPLQAPGRLTSSPWPERIEIDTLNSVDEEAYAVVGRVIEITSAEINTGRIAVSYAVSLAITKTGGRWLISDYQVIEGP